MTVINEHEGMSNDGDRVEELQNSPTDTPATPPRRWRFSSWWETPSTGSSLSRNAGPRR